jgi:hypothetical protein
VYKIQFVLNFEIYKALCQLISYRLKRIVKFTIAETVYVMDATDFQTFGKHKDMKMSGQ